MSTSKTQRASRPLQSYLLRVVEQRVLTVSTVYELHDIASGTQRRFDSLDALQKFLAQRRHRAG